MLTSYNFSLPLLQTQAANYSSWNGTVVIDNAGVHNRTLAITCLGEHRQPGHPPHMDLGSMPEESASPARCMIHPNGILSPLRNVPHSDYTEALQLLDSVSDFYQPDYCFNIGFASI